MRTLTWTPSIAPGGDDYIVNLVKHDLGQRQRTPAEAARATFRAENHARFKAMMQETAEGLQAGYTIEADASNSTNVLSDIRLFKTEPDALLWLDQAAAMRGFAEYPLERRLIAPNPRRAGALEARFARDAERHVDDPAASSRHRPEKG